MNYSLCADASCDAWAKYPCEKCEGYFCGPHILSAYGGHVGQHCAPCRAKEAIKRCTLQHSVRPCVQPRAAGSEYCEEHQP